MGSLVRTVTLCWKRPTPCLDHHVTLASGSFNRGQLAFRHFAKVQRRGVPLLSVEAVPSISEAREVVPAILAGILLAEVEFFFAHRHAAAASPTAASPTRLSGMLAKLQRGSAQPQSQTRKDRKEDERGNSLVHTTSVSKMGVRCRCSAWRKIIVRNKKQAKAILLSYLRKEGRIGPREGKSKKKKAHRKRIAGKRSTA